MIHLAHCIKSNKIAQLLALLSGALYFNLNNSMMADLVHLAPRNFDDLIDPLDGHLSAQELYQRYRLNAAAIQDLTDLVTPYLPHPNHRGRPIPPHIKVCATLRYLASNNFQKTIGDTFNMDQSSVSRSVHAAVDTLSHHIGEYVHFPTTVDSWRASKNGFYNLAHFPNVCGCIDGTHVRILQPPGEDSYAYMNRKRYYSLNVQLVVDVNGRILNVVARWPGSSHDSWILRQS